MESESYHESCLFWRSPKDVRLPKPTKAKALNTFGEALLAYTVGPFA